MNCPDDDQLVAFVEAALSGGEATAIEDHLDRCEPCLTVACALVRTDHTDSLALDATVQSSATAEAMPAPRIGRYTLGALIGRGGMGAVYVAHDPQLDRNIALKVVRAERFHEPEVRARLSAEARAMAKIRHPNVVVVHDAGELDDGVFIAMELIEGATLRRWLEVPRNWREIVRMFVAVGRGLAAAHAAGIIHRDFKPDNVLVDAAGHAAVGDFGLAIADVQPAHELAALPLAEATARSRTGALAGTPLYMSPEQFAGEPLDARTDQFSFAVALHDALYEQKPFDGDSLGELAAAVQAGRLRARPPRTRIPARVHRVIVRALGPAGARFPTMTELLDELERAARRSRAATWIAAGAAAVLVAGVVIGVRHAGTASPLAIAVPDRESPRTAAIIARFDNSTGDPRLDDTLDAQLAQQLTRSTQLDALAGTQLAAAESHAGASATSPDALAAQLVAGGTPVIAVHGTVARRGPGFAITVEAHFMAPAGGATGPPLQFATERDAASADDALAAAAAIGEALLVALHDPAAGGTVQPMSRSLDAVHAWARGDALDDAGDETGETAQLRAAIAADPQFAPAHALLGLLFVNSGHPAEAADELGLATRSADQLPERTRLGLLADYTEAVGRYQESIAATEQLLASWPRDRRTEINLVATAIEASSWPLALEFARRAVADYPRSDVARANLVLVDLANERLADAIVDGDTMLSAIARPTAQGVLFIGLAHALRGEPALARATYQRLTATQPELAAGAEADLDMFEGKLDAADALWRTWIAAAAARGRPEDALGEQVSLADVLLRRGDRDAAYQFAIGGAHLARAPRPAYLAYRTALRAHGSFPEAADAARAWRELESADWRMFGELLAGDVALAGGDPREAIAAFRRADRIGHSWFTHVELARAYLAARDRPAANTELTWCTDHRGEAALFESPSLELLPEIEDMRAAATR